MQHHTAEALVLESFSDSRLLQRYRVRPSRMPVVCLDERWPPAGRRVEIALVRESAGKRSVLPAAASDPRSVGMRLRPPSDARCISAIDEAPVRPTWLNSSDPLRKCVCASLNLGITSLPPRSTTLVFTTLSLRIAGDAPAAVIRSPVIATVSAHGRAASPVQIRALTCSSVGSAP